MIWTFTATKTEKIYCAFPRWVLFDAAIEQSAFINILDALYETFWNFISTVMKLGYRDYIGKVLEQIREYSWKIQDN